MNPWKLAIGIALCGTAVQADRVPVPEMPGKSILVWIAGKDPKTAAELELNVLEALAKHSVEGQRFSTLFPQGLPASADAAIDTMRASGCVSLLVLRRRSAINWETPSKEKSLSSLRAFLTHRSQVLNPKNPAEADSGPIEVSNTYRNTNVEINKGEGLLFDLTGEKLVWQGDTQIKTAKDLPTSTYYRKVSEKVADELAHAQLIPPAHK